jgi:hypothetical protein
MKKGFILVSAFLVLSAASAFAAVSVEMGDTVSLVFTYEDPNASFVGLVGNFQGWDLGGAVPMTRDENGVWSVTIQAATTDEIRYKFNVDDEWTEDPTAPATIDDGFGGFNGRVVVANMLGGAGASDRPELVFGMYARIWGEGTWLTKDVLDGEIDGMDLDEISLRHKSYWKIQGDIMPGWTTFMEIKAFDGTSQFWKSNTLTTETPFTTWADGLQNLGDFFFNPFTNWNDGVPMLGHFKANLQTPFLGINTGYFWAKGQEHEFIYNTKNEMDANDGYVELVPVIDLGDNMSLSVLVAPNRIKATQGVYSWATFETAGYTVDLSFNTLSGDTDGRLFYYLDDAKFMTSLGVGGTIIPGLTFQAQGLMNYGPGVADIVDTISAAANVNYEMADLFGVGVQYRFGGVSSETLFGDDDGLKKGLHHIAPSFWVQPIDLLRFSLGSEISYNYTDEELGAISLTPGLTLNLSSDLTVNIASKMTLDLADDAEEAFTFNEASAQVALTNLGTFLTGATINLGYVSADAINNISLLSVLRMDGGITGYVGAMVRLPEVEDATVSTFGGTLGTAINLDAPDFLNPVLFADFSYNFDPYADSGQVESGFELEDDTYRPKNLGSGAGVARLRLGLKWDL